MKKLRSCTVVDVVEEELVEVELEVEEYEVNGSCVTP